MSHCIASRYIISSLYLLVLIQIQTITSEPVTTLIGLISGIWTLYEYAKIYVAEKRSNQELIDTNLQIISVEKHLSELRTTVSRLRQDIIFDRQMENLASNVKKIEVIFDTFKYYKKNFNKTAARNPYANVTYQDFAYTIFRGNYYGIYEILDKICDIVAPNTNQTEIPMTDTLVASSQEFGNFCKTKLSQLQLVGLLLGYLTVIETKGLLMILFAFDIREWLYQDSFNKERRIKQQQSISRYNRIVRKFKALLTSISNEMHTCDPNQHVSGKTYIELENLFQTYVISEFDMTFRNCNKCLSIEDKVPACKVTYSSTMDDFKTLCKETFMCNTPLKNCEPLSKHTAFESNTIPIMCLSPDPFGTRRYDYLAFASSDNRPCKIDGFKNVRKLDLLLPNHAMFCPSCQCVCAQGNKIEVHYKFNTETIFTDYKKNYVMVGARFMKREDVIYLQVRQAKLLPHGGINLNTVKWIELPEHEFDVHEITWTNRSINLDSLRAPEGHVVVGVMLKTQYYEELQHFELKIMHLPFNYTTGLLDNKDPNITISSYDRRRQLKLENKDIGSYHYDNVRDSTDDQFVLFQPSGLVEDGGQSTIPFIDIQDVQPKIFTPLSGIGLFHRGSQKSGGFLGLNLFTYNFTSHLREDHVSDKDLIKSIV